MKKALRSILCILLLAPAANAQMLQSLIGSSNNRNELVTCVKALPDGSSVLGGYIYDIVSNAPTNIDMLLLRVKPDGTILWQKQLGLSAGGDDLLNNLIITQNTNIVAVATMGRSGAYMDNVAGIFRFDTSGNMIWQKYVRITPSSGTAGDIFTSVAELSNGNLIAVGAHDAAPSISKQMICSFTSGGTINYIETRDRNKSDGVLCIAAVGNDVVMSSHWDGALYKDLRFMRYTPGTTSGTMVWDSSYHVTGNTDGAGNMMQSDGVLQIYIRGGKVVASGASAQTWNQSPGIQTVFRCDLATGGNASFRSLLIKGMTYNNNTAFYPTDSATFYVAENPANSFQDAVLWTSPSFTNGQISKIRPFAATGQVLASREFNLPGSQSIFSMDGVGSALIMAGCSNSSTPINNDIYFVESMSSLTNPNATCDLKDDSMWITAPTLSSVTPTETIAHPTSTATYTVTVSNPQLVSTKVCGEVFDMRIHPAAVPGLQNTGDFAVYPNPVSGGPLTLHITGGNAGEADARIMNAMGQLTSSATIHFDASGKAALDTKDLPAGSYFLQLSEAGTLIGVRRFMVTR